MATNVYVDAFNLYYGCLKGTPYRWLDLGTLCTRLLPKDRRVALARRVGPYGEDSGAEVAAISDAYLRVVPGLRRRRGEGEPVPT
jgi:hypothetical protein